MGKFIRISDAVGPRTFGTAPIKDKASAPAQPSSTAASSAVPKLDLYGMALDALRSGTLPATTQFGRVELPTGAAAFRANQRQETAQALDDRKREELEAERYRLTQPGRVYNKEVTAQNRARVQEIDRELSTLRPIGKYNPLMSVAGAVQKGLGQVAQGGGDALAFAEDAVYAPFELISGLKLGDLSDDGFFNRWAADIRRENEGVDQFYQRNMELGGKPAELFEGLGASAVAAAPNAALALATAGGSLAGQTSAGLAAAASSAWNPSVAATVQNAVSSMAKNPMFWTSFSQVVGNGYEKAIADQRTRGETDENLIRTKAALFAIGNGLLNAAVEVGGGIETLPSQLRGGESIWKSWVDSMVDEGKEEVVQGVIERALQNPIYQQENPLFSMSDSNAILNPYTAAQEFAGGAIVGGLLGGGQIALHRLAMANQQGASALDRPEGSVSAAGAYYAGQNDAATDLSAPTAAASSATVQSPSTLHTQKTAPTEETGGNSRLTANDLADYLRVGKKQSVRNAKQAAVDAGESIILTDNIETQNYIQQALTGETTSNTPKAYGKVGQAMADDIFAASDGAFDVEGWYLELVPSDIKHAFDQHAAPKRAGNIALTEQDFLNIPAYIDTYDDILACKTYSSGDKEILLGKKINGYSVIVEVVSGNRRSLHFKNMWGLDTDTYERRYEKRSATSRPGRSDVSANDPTGAYHSASSGPIISEGGQEVNSAGGGEISGGVFGGIGTGVDPRGGAQSQTDALLSMLGENGQKAFRASYRSGSDLPSSFREFSKAYNQGLNGAKESAVEQGRYINTQAAYYAGQNDAAQSLKREKAASRFAQTAGEESGLVYDDFVREAVESGRTIVTTEGENAVYLSGEAAEQVNQVARRLGLRVRFVDSIEVNGEKDAANAAISGAEVRLQKDNPNPVRFLMGHEMTHRIQELAPKEYRAFRKAAANDLVVQRAVRDQIDRHARRGLSITYEAALDEAAADYAGRLVQDGAVLEDFIRQHKENRSLLEKLRDAVRGLVRKLTGAEKKQAQTAEDRLTAALEAAARRAEKLDANKNAAQESGAEKFSINEQFRNELREWFEDGQPNSEQFILGSTGPVLQGLGAIESDIYMNGDKISTILKQHPEMSIQEIQRIPEILEDPTLILKSKGTGKAGDNSRMVLYGSIKAQNGQRVLVVLDLRPNKSGFLLNDMQKVNSAYTKNNPAGFVTGSDVLYADKKRTIPLLRQFGLTITSRQLLQNGSMGSITYDGDRVKMSGVPFSSMVDLDSGGRFSLKEDTVSKSYADILEENELLRERVDYWRGQTRRTKRITTDKKSVDRAARDLVKTYSADLDAGEIAGDLQALYDAMASGQRDGAEYSGEAAGRDAAAIARRLVESAVVDEDTLYQDYSDLRQFLKGTKLTISETDAADLLDYNDLRKRNFGRVTIAKGQTNVDQVYQELAERWPEFFDEARDTHPADQLQRIDDVLGEVYRIGESNPYAASMEEAVTGASNEILETFFDLPQTRKTFADRQAKKLDAAKARGQQQVQRVRELRDARLAELREQNRERTARAVERERTRREKQVERLRSQYAARDAAGRERRSARELRNRIARHASQLSQKLLRPSDKQHIPENLRKTVASVLDAINLESNPKARTFTIDPVTKKRTYKPAGTPTNRTEAFRALRMQYEEILKGKVSFDGVLDPELVNNLNELEKLSSVRLADMNTEQLSLVWKTVKAVESSIRTANKLFQKGRFDNVKELADAIRTSSFSKKTKGNYGGKGIGAVTGFGDRLLNLDMLDSLTFFHLFGEGGDALYHELQTARDQKTAIMERTVELTQRAVGKTDISALQKKTHTFQVEGGEITLSTAQLMSLYELSKRKQAQEHIYKGGLRPSEQKQAANRLGKLDAPADGVQVTREDVARMLDTLTAEEKQLADGLQAIMQGYLADEGNRESMKVFGYKKFTEEHYFPIQSDPHQVQTKVGDTLEGGVRRPVSVAEWGSAKGPVEGANNGLFLGDIFDVFAQHAVDMAIYASHLGVLEDVNRVRNFTFRDAEGSRVDQMKSIIQRVAGNGGNSYLEKLLQDVSGGTARSDVSGLSRLTANYKAASVGLNIRVAVQQPTSYARALAVMDPKYLLDSRVLQEGGWEKALKYAPIAQWKEWGNFEINQGRQFQDILFGTETRMEKLRNSSMALAGAMDSFTWGRLWNACELEVADTRPGLTKGSDAYYQAVAQRFTDVVDQTQVVDNVLGRSQFMRSGDNLAKMAASYMGEPTKSYNLVYRAYRDAVQEQDTTKRKQAGKRLARAAGALTFSMFLNAVAQSLWDAVRDDDDREEKYWDRFFKHILPNFGQNVNPLGMVPYLRDVGSILQGYDVERMDLAAVTGFLDAAQGMRKALNQEGRYTIAGASINLLAELSRMVGLPVATVKRDILGVVRTFAVQSGDWKIQYQIEKAINSMGYSGNRKEFYDIAFGALKDGEMELYQQITSDLISQGVKASSIESAMRKRMEDAAKEDPNFSFSEEARDIIGYRAPYEEEKSEEAFGPNDLGPEAYTQYSRQRADTYRSWANEIEENRQFQRLDETEKDKALESAKNLAGHLALRDHSDGKYQDSDLSTWERWAIGGKRWGVDPTEAILFKLAYDMAVSDTDENGNTIYDSKKENTLEIAGKLLPHLTDRELEYLLSNNWTPEDGGLKELKENKFLG